MITLTVLAWLILGSVAGVANDVHPRLPSRLMMWFSLGAAASTLIVGYA